MLFDNARMAGRNADDCLAFSLIQRLWRTQADLAELGTVLSNSTDVEFWQYSSRHITIELNKTKSIERSQNKNAYWATRCLGDILLAELSITPNTERYCDNVKRECDTWATTK